MKYSREIQFKANESPIRGHGGITCYQGQVIHNNTLTRTETRKWFAEYMHCHPSTANLYLDGLEEFIAGRIAEGYRLDFGPFAVGLKLRGGLPAANAPFEPGRNELAVELTPNKAIKKAALSLRPVNVTVEQPTIYCALQVRPEIKRGKETLYDTAYSDGPREIHCNGKYVGVHPGAVDEGVWIENDDGLRLATGVIVKSDASICDFTLDGHVDPGIHWLVISARYRDEPELRRSRRRLTVIAN